MSIADKQCRSQFLFELVNLPRKGRLRQMQYRSGFCHVLLTGNGKKIAQDLSSMSTSPPSTEYVHNLTITEFFFRLNTHIVA